MLKHLEIDKIRADGGTQSRAELSESVIAEYTEAMTDGAEFPPVKVFWDGQDYWLVDGFHRVKAARKAGLPMTQAIVSNGTLREAILFSVGENGRHGLRRTNQDKRHSVAMLLNDPEWSKWSDREIARRCCVNHHLVAELREILNGSSPIEKPDERIFTTKHGTQATRKVGVKPKKPDEFECSTCGEIFDEEVWHCAKCNEHWLMTKQACTNCHRVALIGGGGKAEVAPVKQIQKPAHVDDGTPANFVSPVPDEVETVVTLGIPISGPLADNERDYWPELDRSILWDYKSEALELRGLCRQFEQEKAELAKRLEDAEFFEAESVKAWETVQAENQSLRKRIAELEQTPAQVKPQAGISPAEYMPTVDLLVAEGQERIQAIELICSQMPLHMGQDSTFVRVRDRFRGGDLNELPQVVKNLRTLHHDYFDMFGPKTTSVSANQLLKQFADFEPFPIPHACAHVHAHAPAHALSLNSISLDIEEKREGEKSARKTKPRKVEAFTAMPGDFNLTGEMREWAKTRVPAGVDLEREFEKFKAFHESKASKFVSWVKAWQTWMLRIEIKPAGATPVPAALKAVPRPTADPAPFPLPQTEDLHYLENDYTEECDRLGEATLDDLAPEDIETLISVKLKELESGPHAERFAKLHPSVKRDQAIQAAAREAGARKLGNFDEWRNRQQAQSKTA